MTSRALLFQPDSACTRLRVALGDGAQRLHDYFLELKQQREDPTRDQLFTRLAKLLPRAERPRPPARAGLHEARERALAERGRTWRAAAQPQMLVLVGDEARHGTGQDTPGNPGFAGMSPCRVLPDDRFWVRAGELPPNYEVLVPIVPPSAIAALRERQGTLTARGGQLGDLDDAALLDEVFSDELLAHLDVARIVSSVPTLVTRTDAKGWVYAEAPIEPATPPLPPGAFVVVAVGPSA